MCATCGCGESEPVAHSHSQAHDSTHEHAGGLVHDHAHEHPRRISLEQDILAKNAEFAAGNRRLFADRGMFVLNLVSSPGSGKTTLLTQTVRSLGDAFPVTVIGGDQQTARDAERIRAAGAPAVQINTGKGCHLDAHGVGHALDQLPLAEGGVLFVENVGNLVCPADFDLGEAAKVVILSVTEGEDKPLKYPNMFAASRLMLLNKIDLLPHVDFDVERCMDYARRVNPDLQILRLSARTGEGMAAWLDWVRAGQRNELTQHINRLESDLAAARARLIHGGGEIRRTII
ncbi:MAG: hydrogenase nickel incorporation protein HypB [Candidatus Competibacteraceae bacterium]|nr:hydrogenase nickel incorporation protein HypB [Candidatus Competibacteraceae bacterium]